MGTFPTADGHVNVAGMGDFARFCELIDAPELAADPRFASAEARQRNRNALEDAVSDVFRTRPSAEWVDLLAGTVPCGPVLRIDEVFADPQVRHLQMTNKVDEASGRTIEVLRPPLNFSDTPATVRSGPPVPGGDTRAVLAELGYDDVEINALVSAGAVATGVPQ